MTYIAGRNLEGCLIALPASARLVVTLAFCVAADVVGNEIVRSEGGGNAREGAGALLES